MSLWGVRIPHLQSACARASAGRALAVRDREFVDPLGRASGEPRCNEAGCIQGTTCVAPREPGSRAPRRTALDALAEGEASLRYLQARSARKIYRRATFNHVELSGDEDDSALLLVQRAVQDAGAAASGRSRPTR